MSLQSKYKSPECIFVCLEKCKQIFQCEIKPLDSSILHVCTANIHSVCSHCSFSLSVVMNHRRPGRTNKKKLIWSENAWPQPWGIEGQQWRDHLWECVWMCACARDIKKGIISLRAKMRLWNWIEHPTHPLKGLSLIAGGHMGCEAKTDRAPQLSRSW